MTSPAPTKKPPPPPRPPLTIVVNVPTMRVACSKCRHSSPALTAGRVEVPLDCRCVLPELSLVLSFPGKDLPIPLDPIGG